MSKEKQHTKVCKYCKTEIPYDAKVCPQCRKKQGGKLKWILIVILVFGTIGVAFGDEDSESNSNSSSRKSETVANEKETDKPESKDEPFEAQLDGVEYKTVFVFDLLEKWDKYVGDYVTVSFKADSVHAYGDKLTVESKYYDETNSRIEVELVNSIDVLDGDWVTISGVVSKELYNGLENAKIDGTGKASKKQYESGKFKYDKKKKKELERREKKFRKSAEGVSYDELMRYPDTYEKKKIKVVVNINEVEPDGMIFPGDIQGTLDGKEVAIYDERDTKEPKLAKGDTITIYGKGNGLTTVKIKQKAGIFSKTIDKYSIPGIIIKYMDLQ